MREAQLSDEVWSSWGLGAVECVGAFNAAQCAFLDYHRIEVFQG